MHLLPSPTACLRCIHLTNPAGDIRYNIGDNRALEIMMLYTSTSSPCGPYQSLRWIGIATKAVLMTIARVRLRATAACISVIVG